MNLAKTTTPDLSPFPPILNLLLNSKNCFDSEVTLLPPHHLTTFPFCDEHSESHKR